MGCDIHLRIERKKDGQWQNVLWVDKWALEHGYCHYPITESVYLAPEMFDSRNYDLFAVLADVMSEMAPGGGIDCHRFRSVGGSPKTHRLWILMPNRGREIILTRG